MIFDTTIDHIDSFIDIVSIERREKKKKAQNQIRLSVAAQTLVDGCWKIE